MLLTRCHDSKISFLLIIFRVLVGAQSDPSINVDDPISDEFFFVAWNEASERNADIYDKVTNHTEGPTFVCLFVVKLDSFCLSLCCCCRRDAGLQMSAAQLCPQLARAERVLGGGAPLRQRPRAGEGGAEGHPRVAGSLPSQVPLRGEPAASAGHEGRHGSRRPVDINKTTTAGCVSSRLTLSTART